MTVSVVQSPVIRESLQAFALSRRQSPDSDLPRHLSAVCSATAAGICDRIREFFLRLERATLASRPFGECDSGRVSAATISKPRSNPPIPENNDPNFIGLLILEMLPCPARYSVTERNAMHAVIQSQLLIGPFPVGVSLLGFNHLSLRQDSAAMNFPVRRSALRDFVVHIIGHCAGKEVFNVNTRRIVAVVKNSVAFWQNTSSEFKGYGRGAQTSIVRRAGVNDATAIRFLKCSNPQDTPTFRCWPDVTLKANRQRRGSIGIPTRSGTISRIVPLNSRDWNVEGLRTVVTGQCDPCSSRSALAERRTEASPSIFHRIRVRRERSAAKLANAWYFTGGHGSEIPLSSSSGLWSGSPGLHPVGPSSF